MSKDYNREQQSQQNKWNQPTNQQQKQKQNPHQERINQSGQRPSQGTPSQQKPLNRDSMRDKKEQHK